MDTFWLKIAGGAVGVLIVVVVASSFLGNRDQNAGPEKSSSILETKSFSDQVEEDQQRYAAEPQPMEEKPAPESTPAAQPAQNVQAAQPTQPATQPAPKPAPKPTIIYVKPLEDFQEMDAQRLWNNAVPGRSIGRLPMTGYSLAVKGCQEIIQRYPDSKYAFMAARMLNDIPENRRPRVTARELDVSRFYTQRPGTEPMEWTETDN